MHFKRIVQCDKSKAKNEKDQSSQVGLIQNEITRILFVEKMRQFFGHSGNIAILSSFKMTTKIIKISRESPWNREFYFPFRGQARRRFFI